MIFKCDKLWKSLKSGRRLLTVALVNTFTLLLSINKWRMILDFLSNLQLSELRCGQCTCEHIHLASFNQQMKNDFGFLKQSTAEWTEMWAMHLWTHSPCFFQSTNEALFFESKTLTYAIDHLAVILQLKKSTTWLSY